MSVPADLRDHVGESLRSVARYDADGYEVLYLREDVDADYVSEELGEIYDDLVLSGLGTTRVESLFNAGDLECTVYGFEDASVFHVVSGRESGLVVSVDSDTAVNMAAFSELLHEVAAERT